MIAAMLMGSTLLGLAAPAADSLPLGRSKITLEIKETPLEVFCYKPQSYTGERMIMVLHGTLRNAEEYRDNSEKMGERFGALIVAPLFDAERFPSIRYQRGGITRRDGTAAPREEWTYAFIPKIAEEVRKREGKRQLPYWLIGHSAGGQFLVRMAGFFDSGAERIVAANAGSALFPTRDMPFGYGFGGLPPELSSDDVIRRYLAQPLTLYVGTLDSVPDQYFDESPEAMKQGPGRYQRNLAVFQAGKELAEQRGWPFGWRIVEARAINHDHQMMFDHPRVAQALFGTDRPAE